VTFVFQGLAERSSASQKLLFIQTQILLRNGIKTLHFYILSLRSLTLTNAVLYSLFHRFIYSPARESAPRPGPGQNAQLGRSGFGASQTGGEALLLSGHRADISYRVIMDYLLHTLLYDWYFNFVMRCVMMVFSLLQRHPQRAERRYRELSRTGPATRRTSSPAARPGPPGTSQSST